MSGLREGSTSSYRRGSLKRRIPSIRIAEFSNSETPNGTNPTGRIKVRGLEGSMKFMVSCGIVSPEGDETPIEASAYPAGGATMQITPTTQFPDLPPMWGRPVFQDPTSTTNTNQPQPQDLPFMWMVDGDEADGFVVDVAITNFDVNESNPWGNSNVNGILVLQLTVEFIGDWWDTKAIEFAMGQIRVSPGQTPIPIISTGGE